MLKIPETPLCQLAFKYRSDRCPKGGKHTYTLYYFDLFQHRKNAIKKVLEIGIGQGANLLMWRDFFPQAQIYGADAIKDKLIQRKRIRSFFCDPINAKDLTKLIRKIGPNIDLVIDDASHLSQDQVFTCKALMPLLSRQVTYIIEDVANTGMASQLEQYEVEIPNIRQFIRRYDNHIIVVRHKKKPVKISFFAKNPTPVPPDGHLQRVSSIIRGYQIAKFLNAKMNPTAGYEDDTCIYVKPPHKPGAAFSFVKKSYLDVVDETGYDDLLKKHPEVGVISLSDWNYKLLRKNLPNKIVNIPQQHCNFERLKRTRSQVTTVGAVGTLPALKYLPAGLAEELKKRGMNLLVLSKFATRQDIVNFYLNIDVQIVWRPYLDYRKTILVNPLKIVNASSFGIPTIAYEEKAFAEVRGCYLPAHTFKEFLVELDKLRSDPALYSQYAQRCLKNAEKYHIEKIARLYKKLLE